MRRIIISLGIGSALTSATIRAVHVSSIDDAVNLGFALAAGFAVIAFGVHMVVENRRGA